MSKGRPRTRITILDRPRLGHAITEMINEMFGGKLKDAASSIGIERSLLSRLANGSAHSLGVADLGTLRRQLPRELFTAIERSVYPEGVIELLNAYDSWVMEERERFLHRESMPETVTGRALKTVLAWETQRLLEYDYLREVVADKFPDLIADMDKFLVRRKHFQTRGDLAYIRILSPLLDSLDSGHIERRWQEMPDRELRAFVEAGIAREKILLDRAPDLQRAQEVFERDPLDYIALYGQLWDPRAFFGRNTHPLITRWVSARRREVEAQEATASPSRPRKKAD
jgi:hypothetical protein